MYSLTEYKVGSKILSICAIGLIFFGYFLYNTIESMATDIYSNKYLYTN